MSEVALVAAITGGTSVLTSGITATVTWRVSKNSSSVELAKIVAENKRLQQVNREDERRNRQSTYHQFADVLVLLFQNLGFETPLKARQEVCSDYTHLLSGVLLFGPPSVRNGANALNSVYQEIWTSPVMDDTEKSPEQRWCEATKDLRDEFGEKVRILMDLMHSDVTRGIADDHDR